MAQTRTITARDPITGATFKRRTARTYHAAVIIDTAAGPKAMAWVGRPELAPKQLDRYSTAGEPARLALVAADPWAEPGPAAAPVDPARAVADQALAALAELSAEAEPEPAAPEDVARLGFATFNPATEGLSETLPPDCYPPAAPSLAAVARPHLPGEAPTPKPAPSHGTAAPKLPDLKGAADRVAALEFLAGGGALSSDVWVALGWPFEAFLAWAQRPDADARESALRARIRRDGVAASLANL